MRAGCLWSFQAFHLAGDEVGDGLVDLEPAFVDCRGGALSPPGFQGLMKAAIESVGADLCVGPGTGPVKRRVRADT